MKAPFFLPPQTNITCNHSDRGVRENGTWSDILGRVNDRVCDMTFGGYFPDNEVHEDFWTTDSYFEDPWTWYIKLAVLESPWKGLATIFNIWTWLYLFATLIISWIAWFTIGKISQFETAYHSSLPLTALNTFGLTICVAVFERPDHHPLRIFFMALTLFSLNLVCIYTSKLIDVFTNPAFEHQISTMNEVIERQISFGGPKENQDWFNNENDELIFRNYNRSDGFDNIAAVAKGQRVILSNKMYILQNELSDNIYAFPKPVINILTEAIMKEGFPFLFHFNVIIRNMRDCGLFDKIYSTYVWKETYLNRIRKNRPEFPGNY